MTRTGDISVAVSAQPETDQRRYFRVRDQVALRYQVVPAADVERVRGEVLAGGKSRVTLPSTFTAAAPQMERLLRRIKAEEPDIAAYLDLLNRKLDLMAEALSREDNELLDHPTCEVDLSGSGLSFPADEEISPYTSVRLELLLFPSLIQLRVLGEVARCIPAPEGAAGAPYRCAVELTTIREEDREVLIQHVMQRQSERLRAEREGRSLG